MFALKDYRKIAGIPSVTEKETMQVALNLDLAGVESFVKERLGKEVSMAQMRDNIPLYL